MENAGNYLLQLLMKEEWTAEEKKWLLRYFETSDKKTLDELLQQRIGQAGNAGDLSENASSAVLEKIHEAISSGAVRKKALVTRMRRIQILAAACLLAVLCTLVFFWVSRNNGKVADRATAQTGTYKSDALPGTNKAILTLADGSKMELNDSQSGLLTSQGNTKIIKLGNKLAYADNGANTKKILFNTIATPRAAQYQVQLHDGTMVWLNAASSLRFPTAFTGSERRVEVTGEAYFEVAKNKAQPFIVKIGTSEVKVLGTHFNVMAYEDEDAIRTTLLEGAVQFAGAGKLSTLRPGQQSQMTGEGDLQVLDDINVERVTAWKNGMFDFENADIATIMRQLSRWYDVQVVFKTKNKHDQFMLELPRSSRLSDVLKILELTGNIKFEIDGKTVIVFS